jgi:hypothetical protein
MEAEVGLEFEEEEAAENEETLVLLSEPCEGRLIEGIQRQKRVMQMKKEKEIRGVVRK